MYIYNVTIKLEPSIENEWLAWMKDIHIPEVMSTGFFVDARLCLLVEPVNIDDDGVTYVVQYFAESETNYNTYIEEHAPTLRQRGFDKFGNQFIAFRSLLKTIA